VSAAAEGVGGGSGRRRRDEGRRWKRTLRVPRDVDRQAHEDVESEIEFHLDMRTQELIGEGMEPGAARRKAEAEFGDRAAARRSLEPGVRRRERRDRSWTTAWETWRDVRYAVRSLGRSPGFLTVSILTLGLAIGANAAIFSVADAVLFRPLPYRDPGRLVAVWEHRIGGDDRNYITSATLIDWMDEQSSMEVFGAYSFPLGQALAGDQEAQEVQVLWMTPSAFEALGVPPVAGRLFAADEGVSGSPNVAVLSHRLWRDRFGGEDMLGRTITLDDVDYEVVGVMGPEFDFPHLGIDVWLNLRFSTASEGQNRGAHQWRGIGRLAPGLTASAADAELDALSARLELAYPEEMQGWRANVLPFRDLLTSGVRPLFGVLLGVVAIVLLVACANLANLFLARQTARARELAVRSALGAGRSRLVSQLAAESTVVAAAGILAGVLLGYGAMRGFVALAPADIPLLDTVRIDRSVLAYAVVATVLATFLFGLLPAFRSARVDPAEALSEGGSRTTGGRSHRRLRAGILVTQVALSVVLLFGAALLTRSLIRLQSVDYGFEPEGLVAAWTRLPTARYPGKEEQDVFYASLLDRVAALPGVVSVAGTTEPPVIGYQMTFSWAIEGKPSSRNDHMYEARDLRVVTPGYFETMGMRLLRGRPFRDTDDGDAPGVAIIGEALAEVWQGEDPVGSRIALDADGPWFEVIGVVSDVRHRSPREALPAIYIPWSQRRWSWMTWMSLMVRADGDPRALVRPVRSVVWEIDPRLPVPIDTPVTSLYAESRAQNRFATVLLTAFAGLTVLLGAIGLYGVLSYAVGQRRQEIGVRMALGAGEGRIARWVMWDGLRLCGMGLVLGLGAAMFLGRALRTLLYGVGLLDPITIVGVPLILACVTAVAGWVPARRAARTEPSIVLREG